MTRLVDLPRLVTMRDLAILRLAREVAADPPATRARVLELAAALDLLPLSVTDWQCLADALADLDESLPPV